MPILWALPNSKIDERQVLMAMLDREPETVTGRPGLLVIADKGFASKEFEADLVFRTRSRCVLRSSARRSARARAS
ncbi:hypothetical protein ACFYPN_31815 [Streptomyces sp. NPDC005576]|uniref:hypothetical protein n=1 Tax=unclassified Streptomyces TaxID=2593676 RepID=UPI0033D5C1E0